MSVKTFSASCRKSTPTGQCAETFSGADGVAALKAHLKEAHKGTRFGIESTPAWISPKPFPLGAPRRTAGGIEAVEARIADGGYDVVIERFGAKVRPVEIEVAA